MNNDQSMKRVQKAIMRSNSLYGSHMKNSFLTEQIIIFRLKVLTFLIGSYTTYFRWPKYTRMKFFSSCFLEKFRLVPLPESLLGLLTKFRLDQTSSLETRADFEKIIL